LLVSHRRCLPVNTPTTASVIGVEDANQPPYLLVEST
jgi:hypothetical protein